MRLHICVAMNVGIQYIHLLHLGNPGIGDCIVLCVVRNAGVQVHSPATPGQAPVIKQVITFSV